MKISRLQASHREKMGGDAWTTVVVISFFEDLIVVAFRKIFDGIIMCEFGVQCRVGGTLPRTCMIFEMGLLEIVTTYVPLPHPTHYKSHFRILFPTN